MKLQATFHKLQVNISGFHTTTFRLNGEDIAGGELTITYDPDRTKVTASDYSIEFVVPTAVEGIDLDPIDAGSSEDTEEDSSDETESDEDDETEDEQPKKEQVTPRRGRGK